MKKISSVFGGHIISINIPPRKKEESFSYPLQMEGILPPKSPTTPIFILESPLISVTLIQGTQCHQMYIFHWNRIVLPKASLHQNPTLAPTMSKVNKHFWLSFHMSNEEWSTKRVDRVSMWIYQCKPPNSNQ
jgi:hypothetical protein